MTDELAEFLRTGLDEMNYPVEDLSPGTPLGPEGLDVDSLARTEIALRISDDYGVELSEVEIKEMAGLTFGELTELLRTRLAAKD